ncbi:hypothetical protein HYDPIDRAFT_104954 [Hydnomerulius pinastri MD-312]|nr:hypothetical protein HYDPIDRAFT_104954 [Hydnomerulius pinastri MD-312]
MSFTPREIGTLIVVVLKAKNLPNKRHIGKQAPYCLVTLSEDKRRTKVIKRGGQHPEWDEEFRFTIYEDVEAGLVRAAQGSDVPPPLPPKNKGPKKIKGGGFMRLQCYADDARDPDFIGETLVDLTEALTKGETDEWFTLMNKDKYSGEVYLELTFWSNEPPPEKKSSRKPTVSNKNYGGPGSFVPADGSNPSLNGSAHSTPSRGTPSSSSLEINHLDSLPSSLRASGSRPELYAPPYEQRNRASPVDQMASDFAELGVMDSRRRESYPPANHTLRPSTSAGFNSLPLQTSQSFFEQQGPSDGSSFAFDNVITPTAPPSRLSLGSSPYYPPYENGSTPTYAPSVRNHGPRYSMPTSSSSGFVPIPNTPAPSSYGMMTSYSSEPSSFIAPQGHPTHPPPSPHPASNYSPHRPPPHPTYTPISATPAPFTAPPPPPTAASHRVSHSLSTPPSHSYQQYQLPPPAHEQAVPFPSQSAPPQEYANSHHEYVNHPPPPASLPPPNHTAPPYMYPGYAPTTPSPPREYPPPPAMPSSSSSTGSRPLPQPGQPQRDRRMSQPSQPQRDRRLSVVVPPSSSFPQQLNGRSPNQPSAAFQNNGSYPSAPPPVPQNYHRIPSAQSYSPGHPAQHDSVNGRAPPLPAPPSQVHNNPSPVRPSLPQPPLGYHSVQPAYQPLPPPPAPPDMSQYGQLPPPLPSSYGNNSYFPGPPPRPPQPHANYGQPLPAPPIHGDWQ